MAHEILNEIFQSKMSWYNLQKKSSFYVRQVHSVYQRIESPSFLGLKIQELVPEDLKQSESLDIFKSKFKN